MRRTWKGIGAAALLAIAVAVSFQVGRRSAERVTASSSLVPSRAGENFAQVRAATEPAASEPAVQTTATISLPAESVAELLALPTDFSQTYAAYALAAHADEDALLALIEDAKQTERDNDRLALITIFIGRYGEMDPVRALRYIADSDLEMKPNLVFRVVNSWSKVDLDAAIDYLSRLDGQARQAATDAILAAYSDGDRGFLADLRARLARPAVAAGPSPAMVLRLASSDPAAALTEALRLGGPDRMTAILGVGAIWAQTDPEAALAHSRTVTDPTIRDALQRGIFVTWVDRDAASVLRLLEPGVSETESSAILNAAVVWLAQRDPRQAFTQVASVEDAALRNAALQRVFRTWAQQDPFAASAALDEVAGEDMANLAALVGREFALRAPAEALDWASGFEDNFGATYRIVLTEVAKSDPRIALASAIVYADVGNRPGIFGMILSTVAQRDPVAAAGFWQQVPADARAEAAAALVVQWQMTDSRAAAAWLLGLPAGPDRDAGLDRFVAAAPSDDQDVLRVLNAMSSIESRDRSALTRIRRLARSGELAQAQLELGQIDLSAEAHRNAIAVIDSSR